MKKRVLFTLACLFLWTGMAMAQVSRITGVVVSAEDNEPIVGASVLVKGTTLGTITDMNGRYSINVSIRPRACFFPLFSFLPLWLHYNLNPLCVQY